MDTKLFSNQYILPFKTSEIRYVEVETWHPSHTSSTHRSHAWLEDGQEGPDRVQALRHSVDSEWQERERPRIADDSLTSLEVDSSLRQSPSLLASLEEAVALLLPVLKDLREVRYGRE